MRRVRRKLEQGTNLYELSGEMPAYRNLMIEEVNGAQNKIIVGGKEIYPGDILNDKDESTFRRVQIRETILSHLKKEKQYFDKGIKVLPLFFIDSVEKYRVYDKHGDEAHEINKLTVIASESYEAFGKGLQNEIASTLKERPQKVEIGFFVSKMVENEKDGKYRLTSDDVKKINTRRLID